MQRKEILYKFLRQVATRLKNDQKSLAELIDKNVILLFGSTGSGKSTLANSILFGSSSLIKDENGLIEIKQDQLKEFKIGHNLESMTKAPNFYHMDDEKNLFLVDGPGTNDSCLRYEFAN